MPLRNAMAGSSETGSTRARSASYQCWVMAWWAPLGNTLRRGRALRFADDVVDLACVGDHLEHVDVLRAGPVEREGEFHAGGQRAEGDRSAAVGAFVQR